MPEKDFWNSPQTDCRRCLGLIIAFNISNGHTLSFLTCRQSGLLENQSACLDMKAACGEFFQGPAGALLMVVVCGGYIKNKQTNIHTSV